MQGGKPPPLSRWPYGHTTNIECSADGTTWTALASVPEFAKAPGKPGYTANTIVSFAGVPAKFVKLTIEKTGASPRRWA